MPILQDANFGNYFRRRNKRRCYDSGHVVLILKLSVFISWALFSSSAFATWTPLPVEVTTSTKATYIYSSGTGSVTPAAAATDIIVIKGSATKTIKVLDFVVCPSATAAGAQTMFLVKRSTANTAGTSAANTGAALDSNSAAVSSSSVTYSVNPTGVGTAVFTRPRRVFFNVTAGTTAIEPCTNLLQYIQDNINAQPITLRGVAESLALNNNGAALAAGYKIDSWYAIVTEE